MQAVLSTATRPLGRSILIFSALLLTACGGGGGGGGSGLTGGQAPAPAPGPSQGYPTSFPSSSLFRNVCANPRSQDQQGSSSDENNWLRSWSNELYLWYDEIVDEDPAAFSTPAYFSLMKTFALTPEGPPRDRFHFSEPTDEFQARSQSGLDVGYGAYFALLAAAVPRDIRIGYLDPGTPASAAGLARGTRVLAINGEDVATTGNVALLNAALFPGNAGERYTFTVRDPGATTSRDVTLTSQVLTLDPVNVVEVLPTATGNVGYLAFQSHIAPSEAQLIDAVRLLANAAVTDLVLDLRYNGGGFLDIANELAYMIAGPSAASGRVFDEIRFSDKHPARNPVTGQALSPDFFHAVSQGFSVPAGRPLPSLSLPRVFVLTGSRTCSASEAIINGLRGIDLEVVQIGTTTCGKPYGFYPFDNCGTTYFSIQFQSTNAKGFGAYSNGFSPEGFGAPGVPLSGCEIADDFEHALGDPSEARLAAALEYRASGSCPAQTLAAGRGALPLAKATPAGAEDGAVLAPREAGMIKLRPR